mgnify:CR=1 FL=1
MKQNLINDKEQAFLSKKLAKGRNSSAINTAKKSGAKMVFPIFARYPIAKLLTKIRASLNTNGSLISFIKQSNNKNVFDKKNASNI